MMTLFLLVLQLISCTAEISSYYPEENEDFDSAVPVIMWHGMGDSCCYPWSLGQMKKLLEQEVPGVYVNSLMIGKNVLEDTENSYFMNVNDQVSLACSIIKNDSKLQGGYNAVGFSQGGLFLRALAQRCPDPPMRNLVSIGGPQQGVFGFPHCPGGNYTVCEFIRKLLNIGAYTSYVQNHLVQAEYWHDPLNEAEYKRKSAFLADINNENDKKEEYRNNLLKLSNLVLVKFNHDTMVVPKDSEWFGFFTTGQDKDVYQMEDSALYKEDWIGLKGLDNDKRLHLLSTDGDHLQFTEDWFIANIVKPYLL